MEPTTEDTKTNIPLFAFNISLVALIVSLGVLIYRVDTQKAHIATDTNTQVSAVFVEPMVQASSYVVFDIGSQKIIAEKDAQTPRPLASLTKIMSAFVAREMLPKETEVRILKEFLVEEGDSGLRDGEVFKLSDLLDLSLIVSSNDGARSLASVAGAFKLRTVDYSVGRSEFIKEMNTKAVALGFSTLAFTNETGLDNADGSTGGYGSALDVAHLFAHVLKQYPELLEATRNEKETIRSAQFSHEVINTNSSLSEIPNVIASKTGFTNMAGGNLAIVFDAGFGNPIAIVVLGSTTEGRFSDVVALASSTLQYIKQ